MSFNNTNEDLDFEGFGESQVHKADDLELSSSKEITHRDQVQCDYCSFVTSDEVEFGTHLRRHMGVKPYTCDECCICFVYEDSYKSHMWSKHK